MASKPSTHITTSTTAEQDPMPSQQSTAHGKKESSVAVTSSTPNPVPTSIVQRYVTDAAEIISATPAYRKMFIIEVFRKFNEIAQWGKESGKHLQSLQNPHQHLEDYQSMQYTQITVMESSFQQRKTKL